MARETALQRAKRLLIEEREEHAHTRAWAEAIIEERNRLSKRCSFLYEKAMEFATDAARERLASNVLLDPRIINGCAPDPRR